MNLFDLNGDIAFVTGAGSGIGQRIAVGLAEHGADICGFDLATSTGLADTLARVRALGRRALACHGDVVQPGDLAAAVAACESQLGAMTIAINSAGIASATPAEDLAPEHWRHMIDVNLTGVFLSCQAQARVMLARGKGSIVNVASMSGSIVNRGLVQAHYNSSKAGVIHLSKSLAMEWVARGLRVNVISPGYTLTPMNLRPEVAEQRAKFESETPIGRMATVDEMVGPAVFLSSRAASYVTGVDLLVDGGFCCW
jgi:NAD(P)-dependent dehydrogenase (short-subunit alcohol dehydrogenase family)